MSRLEIKGLNHAYALKNVLQDIRLTLDAGRLLALVGPSGCGKTTLLHLCAGLLAPQHGAIENTFVRPAVMFQQPRLLPWKTVRDNIALGLRAAGVGSTECRWRAQETACAVGLDDLALGQFPHTLSGGMQSRAALARALVLEPDLLLMDEPFSALDIGLKGQMHRLLLEQQARRGVAVLMITHDLMEAVRLADTVLVMAPGPGRIVHCFQPPIPAHARSETDVYHITAKLLQIPTVRSSFALPPDIAGSSAILPDKDAHPGVLLPAAPALPEKKVA
ncbi:MAG TPA: ABC transporter ATP-binding protein [Burkholderiaceae bacterium]|jgi:NitT/TauT family transport system ATP-binding protein|nr:ABC transporter ATP-binding protein [Burkholderiaceae bacterium]